MSCNSEPDSMLFALALQIVLVRAIWRHKLQRRHISYRLIIVREGCTFHWCIDCRKYHCLIYRGRKLLGWPSYCSETDMRPETHWSKTETLRILSETRPRQDVSMPWNLLKTKTSWPRPHPCIQIVWINIMYLTGYQ